MNAEGWPTHERDIEFGVGLDMEAIGIEDCKVNDCGDVGVVDADMIGVEFMLEGGPELPEGCEMPVDVLIDMLGGKVEVDCRTAVVDEVREGLMSLAGTAVRSIGMQPGGLTPLKTTVTVEPKTQKTAFPSVKRSLSHWSKFSRSISN